MTRVTQTSPHTPYTLTVPVFRRHLGNLRAMLQKAEAQCAKSGLNEAELLTAQLAPDMFPFVRQVQMTAGMAVYVTANLSGRPSLALPDTETSLGELELRIDRVDGWLAQVPGREIDARAPQRYALPSLAGKTVSLPRDRFVTEFALPNFFFHLSMSYALLRAGGVPLGKSDYIGPLTE